MQSIIEVRTRNLNSIKYTSRGVLHRYLGAYFQNLMMNANVLHSSWPAAADSNIHFFQRLMVKRIWLCESAGLLGQNPGTQC